MKHLSTILLGLGGALGLGCLQSNAAPTVYVSNQTNFEAPFVFVCGFGVPDDWSTWFDFGYNGVSEGQITVDGLTYDKFSLPEDAIGVTASIQYSDTWKNNKPDYEVTFEDKDYFLIAKPSGLQEYTPGGINEYMILYLDNKTTIEADKNSLRVYAVADDGTELFGPYPGAKYGCTGNVDGQGFYLYDMPKGNKKYKFTFSNEDCGFKLESDFTHIPSGHAFVTVTDNACESLGNLLSADITEGLLSYTLDKSAKTAVVNGLADPTEGAANLVIPSTLTCGNTEYAVTAIKDGAFDGLKNLTGSLTLGDNLVTIGDNAFNGCQNLTGALTIGDKVTYIGSGAFSACISMNGALTIGSSVAIIKDNAFLMCSKLTGALNLPAPLTEIGQGAFSGCSSLDGELTFGENLTYIGKQAFLGCSKLTGALAIPSAVTFIGEGAFMSCNGLNGALTLPSGITELADNLFFGCSGLTGTLHIPSSVTAIGRGAFYECKGFTGTLTIPEGVVEIGFRTFAWNWSLSALELPSTLQALGNLAFYGCWNLTSITCNAETAPVITSPNKAFDNDNYTNATLYVPAADFMSYKNGYEWSNFEKIVAVDGIAAEEVSLNSTEISITVDETFTLTATVAPADTTDPTVTWTSSDESIATVEDGIVKGIAAGTATITATCGDVTAQCAVTVTTRAGVEEILCDDNQTVEYYNLQGIRISEPADGEVVIMKKSGTVTKMVFTK